MRESCLVYCYSGIQSLFEVVLLYTFYTYRTSSYTEFRSVQQGLRCEDHSLPFASLAIEWTSSNLRGLCFFFVWLLFLFFFVDVFRTGSASNFCKSSSPSSKDQFFRSYKFSSIIWALKDRRREFFQQRCCVFGPYINKNTQIWDFQFT